jgi:hypothetical protein
MNGRTLRKPAPSIPGTRRACRIIALARECSVGKQRERGGAQTRQGDGNPCGGAPRTDLSGDRREAFPHDFLHERDGTIAMEEVYLSYRILLID